MLKEPPRPFSKQNLTLYMCSLVGFFCSTMNGYDGSLLNGLLINDNFTSFFHGADDGIWAGIVTSMYQIGAVVALPFVGPCIDRFGRKGGMFIGAMVIIIGTVINATTYWTASIEQFEAGRFVLGFGVSITSAAGPMYVVETAHPAYRGKITALYNTWWFTGSIIAAGAVRGALNTTAVNSWTVPIWLQMLFSGLIVAFVWFLPESPRWLYVHDRRDKCKEILTKYHGNGNEDSVWVQLQLREYDDYLNLDGTDKRWWDYRALFKDRASIYRVGCNVTVAVFGQWAGNSVLTYFMSTLLTTAGYTTALSKANINLIYACTQFLMAILGSLFVDRFGRRALLLFACVGCSLVWIGMTVSTSQYALYHDPSSPKGALETDLSSSAASASSKAATAMIFLFGAVFSFGFTPLQVLYPVEVLSFEIRAKGMALSGLAMNVAMLLNQFAWPVAMQKIGWKTYVIFVVWDALQAVVVYFFIPETKGRTLEELDDIFSAPNPRKASTRKRKVVVEGKNSSTAVEV
ncbi:general substrate transporter [Saccharata proteae CBS 121410]|uniref:General substrate transporter n=1 Tax=Saccharata proteae CBS 121410 TaxID=1314787 RepID=A0A9P4LYR7_9PEZI|nr:general substrate transporter [Saccharata proteae CBS 121410]